LQWAQKGSGRWGKKELERKTIQGGEQGRERTIPTYVPKEGVQEVTREYLKLLTGGGKESRRGLWRIQSSAKDAFAAKLEILNAAGT